MSSDPEAEHRNVYQDGFEDTTAVKVGDDGQQVHHGGGRVQPHEDTHDLEATSKDVHDDGAQALPRKVVVEAGEEVDILREREGDTSDTCMMGN